MQLIGKHSQSNIQHKTKAAPLFALLAPVLLLLKYKKEAPH
jgi:hypothetical protein